MKEKTKFEAVSDELLSGKSTEEVLGLWTGATEGAKLWLQILTELRNRGVQDILIACVDGLKGFPDAMGPCIPRPKCNSASSTPNNNSPFNRPDIRLRPLPGSTPKMGSTSKTARPATGLDLKVSLENPVSLAK